MAVHDSHTEYQQYIGPILLIRNLFSSMPIYKQRQWWRWTIMH